MNINISIEEFNKKFNEKYNLLYNTVGEVAGEREAAEAFDDFAREHRDFIDKFVRYCGDYISSDREAAAFVLALENFV